MNNYLYVVYKCTKDHTESRGQAIAVCFYEDDAIKIMEKEVEKERKDREEDEIDIKVERLNKSKDYEHYEGKEETFIDGIMIGGGYGELDDYYVVSKVRYYGK